tara:strand:- start:11397 stop:12803 length:1407 start_codon:yes stop_codon:yes gene_type:complete
MLKKGSILNLEIDSLTYGGKGISKHQGIVIFTNNVLPGQKIEAKIIKKKKKFLEAIPINIIKDSKHKTKPNCNHFNDCGGCKSQNLIYEEQLKQKYKQVIDSLKFLAKIENPYVKEMIGCKNIFEYRNKMEFSFSNQRWLINSEKDKLNEKPKDFALGLHPPKRFDKIVDIDNCDLQSKIANEILIIIKDMVLSFDLIPYDIINHKGFLRNVVVKHTKFANQIMINIVTAYQDEKSLKPIINELKKISPNIVSIINTINDKKSDSFIGEKQNLLFGKDIIIENLSDFQFQISADSFFQPNSEQALKMYNHIKSESNIKSHETIYDFYCGTGTISIFLSKEAKKVIGFEIVEAAIKDAYENAKINNVGNCEFYCGDLSKMTKTFEKVIKKNPCDVLVLDPPRAGLNPKTTKEIIKINPPKIIYASCNPTTQARDVREFIKNSYIITCVQPIDMFPHTHHIECVITLVKK